MTNCPELSDAEFDYAQRHLRKLLNWEMPDSGKGDVRHRGVYYRRSN